MSAVLRLGFAGLGWIGAMRMDAVAASGRAVVAALCDPSEACLSAAAARHGEAVAFADYDEMLSRAEQLGLDGVVIATPNSLHAPQAIAALERGLAVFCQKPLALNAAEARAIVDAARRADRRLGVDYSYRYTDGVQALRSMVRSGELGRIFAIETAFHNAYGPGKAWCHDPAIAGGGALLDLGVHLIDLCLWILDSHGVRSVRGGAFRRGEPLGGRGIDDFAIAQLELDDGVLVHLAVRPGPPRRELERPCGDGLRYPYGVLRHAWGRRGAKHRRQLFRLRDCAVRRARAAHHRPRVRGLARPSDPRLGRPHRGFAVFRSRGRAERPCGRGRRQDLSDDAHTRACGSGLKEEVAADAT